MASVLTECRACGGLVPPARVACPHCDLRLQPRRFAALMRALGTAAGCGVMAMSLMACYGAPMNRPMVQEPMPPACGEDRDGDGACAPADCDDDDASIYPD